jgi:hypothetical protein
MSEQAGWRGLIAAVPLRASVLVGALAYLAGYLLTIAVLVADAVIAGSDAGGGSETPDQVLEFFGVLFYNAHFVEAPVQSSIVSGSIDFIAELDLFFPGLVYHAVPVALLGVGGALLARRAGDRVDSWQTAAVVGASLVVAYLPLVYLGTHVFTFTGTQSGFEYVVSTSVRRSVLRAGLALPLLCGGLGGIVAYLQQG